MNRTLRLFSLAILCLGLYACASIDARLPPDAVYYNDAPVRLSNLNIYVRPTSDHPHEVSAVFFPFRVTQSTDKPESLGPQLARLFWHNWSGNQVFSGMFFDETLYYRNPQQAAAVARQMGAQLAVVGYVPFFFMGGTAGHTSLTLQIKILDAASGETLVSMEQSGRVEVELDKDYVVLKQKTRTTESPLGSIVAGIAQEMSVPVREWAPAAQEGKGGPAKP